MSRSSRRTGSRMEESSIRRAATSNRGVLRRDTNVANIGMRNNKVLLNIMDGKWNKKPFEPRVENTFSRDAFFSINVERIWDLDVSEQTFKASVVFEIYWEPDDEEKELLIENTHKNWRNRHLEDNNDPSFSNRVIRCKEQPEWKASDYIFEVENALHDEVKWSVKPICGVTFKKEVYFCERIRISGPFLILPFFEPRRSTHLPEIQWFPAPFDVLRLPTTFKFRYSEINMIPISTFNLGPETFFVFNKRISDDTYEFRNAMFEQIQDSYNSDIYYMHATVAVSRNLWAFSLRTLAPMPISTVLPMAVYAIPRGTFEFRMLYLVLCLIVYTINASMLLNTGKKMNNAYTYSDVLVLMGYLFYSGIIGAVVFGNKIFTEASALQMEDLVTMGISTTWMVMNGGWLFFGLREQAKQSLLAKTPLGKSGTLQDSAGLVSKEGLVRDLDDEGRLHFAASLSMGVERLEGGWEMHPQPDPRIGLQILSEIAVEHRQEPKRPDIETYLDKLHSAEILSSMNSEDFRQGDAFRRVATGEHDRARPDGHRITGRDMIELRTPR